MSGKIRNKIGFKPNYKLEEEENEAKNKTIDAEKTDTRSEEEKNKAALEAMAKLTGRGEMSTNEILMTTKLKMYMDLIKSDEFTMKSPEEKEAYLGELLFLQSLSTELEVLNKQMKSVINK